MSEDTAVFRRVESSESSSHSQNVEGSPQNGAHWPGWLDDPWRVAVLWSVITLGLVGLIYVAASGLGGYGQWYQDAGFATPDLTPVGALTGGFLTIVGGYWASRRERKASSRDWIRYLILLGALIPGALLVVVNAVLFLPTDLISQVPGKIGGYVLSVGGLVLVGASMKMCGQRIGPYLLYVQSGGLFVAAGFTAPFAPPDQQFFLFVGVWSVILPVLLGFAALRPLTRRRQDEESVISKSRYYGAAMAFAVGTAYLLVGASFVIQNSGIRPA